MSKILILLIAIFIPFASEGKKKKKKKTIAKKTVTIENESTREGYTELNVSNFGAIGDGKTNNFIAFRAIAAYINKSGGNIKLKIPKGVYMINTLEEQKKINGFINEKTGALHIKNCSNLIIQGEFGTKIKYSKEQKFGSFNPKTGIKHEANGRFFEVDYRKEIGVFLTLEKCSNAVIKDIEFDGNIEEMEIGGTWGDTGLQLLHDALNIFESNDILINNVNCHHFGRDGIMIGNSVKKGEQPELKIEISNSLFEFNGRNGLSWIGGRGLLAKNCKFNNNAKNKAVKSSPASGVDVEAEWGIIEKGVFDNCEFINNYHNGYLQDSGPSSDILLKNCTLVGLTNWSIWVTKPAVTIYNCNIYGCAVHAFDATNNWEATKYIKCNFFDSYKGKECFGNFCLMTNNTKRLLIDSCDFTANFKKTLWVSGLEIWKKEEMPVIKNCNFYQKTLNHVNSNDYFLVATCCNISNCNYYYPLKKNNTRNIFLQVSNSDSKNNQTIYLPE